MRRIIFLITFLFISLCAFSQISRTFLGMTLGVSTKAQCEQKLRNMGVLRVNTEDELGFGTSECSVQFAGKEWHMLRLHFYKNKLYEIIFEMKHYWDQDIEMEIANTTITPNVYNKYRRYKQKTYDSDLKTCDKYSDGKTQIYVLYQERTQKKDPYFAISYSDVYRSNKVFDEYNSSISNDL